jgi:hypothetical protein
LLSRLLAEEEDVGLFFRPRRPLMRVAAGAAAAKARALGI